MPDTDEALRRMTDARIAKVKQLLNQRGLRGMPLLLVTINGNEHIIGGHGPSGREIFFPAVLAHIHHNGEIHELVKHPDTIFNDFSRCKREVEETSHCYKAYSAALQIAESNDCAPQGIMMKRKFKNLVEHNVSSVIEEEINVECGSGTTRR